MDGRYHWNRLQGHIVFDFNGMTVETQVLTQRGFFCDFCLAKRIANSIKIYHPENLILPIVSTVIFNPRDFYTPHILAFLQTGLHQDPAFCTLKG